MSHTTDNYEPFGEEWRAEMSQLTKDQIIDLVAEMGMLKYPEEEEEEEGTSRQIGNLSIIEGANGKTGCFTLLPSDVTDEQVLTMYTAVTEAMVSLLRSRDLVDRALGLAFKAVAEHPNSPFPPDVYKVVKADSTDPDLQWIEDLKNETE